MIKEEARRKAIKQAQLTGKVQVYYHTHKDDYLTASKLWFEINGRAGITFVVEVDPNGIERKYQPSALANL